MRTTLLEVFILVEVPDFSVEFEVDTRLRDHVIGVPTCEGA